jgi:hypothetical protein
MVPLDPMCKHRAVLFYFIHANIIHWLPNCVYSLNSLTYAIHEDSFLPHIDKSYLNHPWCQAQDQSPKIERWYSCCSPGSTTTSFAELQKCTWRDLDYYWQVDTRACHFASQECPVCAVQASHGTWTSMQGMKKKLVFGTHSLGKITG